jgi:hypothetical protein
LVNVHEVDYGESRQNNLKSEYRRILFDCHEVALLGDACEDECLQEYGAAYAA